MRPKARKTVRMSAERVGIEMRGALGNLAHHQRREVGTRVGEADEGLR